MAVIVTNDHQAKTTDLSQEELARWNNQATYDRAKAHRIVILDGYAANSGDLSWKALEELGEVTVYDRTAPHEIIERIAHAEIVLTNKTPLMRETLAQLPRLRYIGVLATGYNIIDIEAAREQGIVVTNIPAYSSDSVAQLVFAHILNIASDVATHSQCVKSGEWASCQDFSFQKSPIFELAGKTLGIVGLGNIGNTVARIAHAFNMQILAKTSKPQKILPDYVQAVDWDTLLAESDIITLHCPLTEHTRNLINTESLARMKPTAIVINTGRGPLINEQDLADALNSGSIRAAGVDVLSQEPPREDNPLITARNCYITPHIAWATFESRQRLLNIAVENVHQYLNGNTVNQVNK